MGFIYNILGLSVNAANNIGFSFNINTIINKLL